MKVLIIEDETAAAINLKALLSQTFPDIEVVATIESVAESVEWFNSGSKADLVFMDIHLADGDSFTIFEHTEVDIPIVFTTAYDQYALDAFKVNSVDYLLKPVKATDLERAVAKLNRLSQSDAKDYTDKVSEMATKQNNRSQALLIHVKDRIVPLRPEEIAYFYTTNEKVSVCTLDNRVYPFDKSLDAVLPTLDNDTFFRANRQFIVSREAISDISVWFGSRLAINLTTPPPERIVVSKARVPEFKRWIAGTDK